MIDGVLATISCSPQDVKLALCCVIFCLYLQRSIVVRKTERQVTGQRGFLVLIVEFIFRGNVINFDTFDNFFQQLNHSDMLLKQPLN